MTSAAAPIMWALLPSPPHWTPSPHPGFHPPPAAARRGRSHHVGCVALASALDYQPAPRLQGPREPPEQPLVVLDPVKSRGGEHQATRSLDLQLHAGPPPRT